MVVNRAEQQIRIAAKMYECRDTLKRLTGDKFRERITEYQGFLRTAMQRYECDEIKAAMHLCHDERIRDSAITQMWLIAAAVELLEPSE